MVLNLREFQIGDTIQNQKTKEVFVVTASEEIHNYRMELTNLKTHQTQEFIVQKDNPVVVPTGDGGQIATLFTEISMDALEKVVLSQNEMDSLRNIQQSLINQRDKTLSETITK